MIQKIKFSPLVKIIVKRIHAILSNIQRPLKPMEKKRHQSSPWDRPVIQTFMCFGLVQYWLDRLFGWCNPCLPDPKPRQQKISTEMCCLFFVGSTCILLKRVDFWLRWSPPRARALCWKHSSYGCEENFVRGKSNCTPSTCCLPDSHRQEEAVVVVLHLAQPQRARARGSTFNQHSGSWWWWF